MKKRQIFYGAATALITPHKNGEIDYDSLCKIIEYQIAGGISALVIGGTTGEAATLTDEERYRIFAFSHEIVRGRVKLILGTGCNDTAAAIRHTRRAEEIGADGVLVVTPYYNKGTVRGVTEHYLKIADSTSLPIILYNVPSRTGVNLTEAQLYRLAREENVVGIKEASDSADRLVRLAAFGEDLWLYAGNDSQAYTALSLGGCGVISVVSNSHPSLVSEMCNYFRRGERERSLAIQLSLLPYIEAVFMETNPAPIKYAMNLIGLAENEMRLPLFPVGEECAAAMQRAMDKLNK